MSEREQSDTQTDKSTQIVEVAVNSGGDRIPVGLMNAGQALALPEEIEFEVSHPDHEAGATETFISTDELLERVSSGQS
jgi:hypothetical protein